VQLPQIHIPLILEFFVLSLWAQGRGVLVACTGAAVMGSNMHFTFGLCQHVLISINQTICRDIGFLDPVGAIY